MQNEYWATFSIYDHRTPLFKQALLLFDRVVVPIPNAPFRSIHQVELDQLRADTKYLQEHDAGISFEWDPVDFETWKKWVADEAISTFLNKDATFDTRLQLQHSINQRRGEFSKLPDGVDEVTAIPIFGPSSSADPMFPERCVFEVVLDRLPVPRPDAPLESVIVVREQKGFRGSIRRLRVWQDETVLELLDVGDDRRKRRVVLDLASRRLEEWADSYREAMHDARFEKIESSLSVLSVLGNVAATLLGGGAPSLTLLDAPAQALKLRTLRQPCWRSANELACAPAGVIYWAKQ